MVAVKVLIRIVAMEMLREGWLPCKCWEKDSYCGSVENCACYGSVENDGGCYGSIEMMVTIEALI